MDPEKFVRYCVCYKVEKLNLIFYGNPKVGIVGLPNGQTRFFQERSHIKPCLYSTGIGRSRYSARGGRN